MGPAETVDAARGVFYPPAAAAALALMPWLKARLNAHPIVLSYVLSRVGLAVDELEARVREGPPATDTARCWAEVSTGSRAVCPRLAYLPKSQMQCQKKKVEKEEAREAAGVQHAHQRRRGAHRK